MRARLVSRKIIGSNRNSNEGVRIDRQYRKSRSTSRAELAVILVVKRSSRLLPAVIFFTSVI